MNTGTLNSRGRVLKKNGEAGSQAMTASMILVLWPCSRHLILKEKHEGREIHYLILQSNAFSVLERGGEAGPPHHLRNLLKSQIPDCPRCGRDRPQESVFMLTQ